MTRYFRTHRPISRKSESTALAEAPAPARRMPAGESFGGMRQTDALAAFLRPSIDVPRTEATGGNDVCAFLFARCQEWQRAFLDGAGITCLFDVDSGALPAATCDTLAAVARTRLRRLAADTQTPGGQVTITLRHRAPMWALAISDTFLRLEGPRITGPEMAALKAFAARLEGAYIIQPVEKGTLMAVMFSTDPRVLCAEALAETRVSSVSKDGRSH